MKGAIDCWMVGFITLYTLYWVGSNIYFIQFYLFLTLNVFNFVNYSITNLKYWGRSEPIISKTLQLLSDLSVGYSSVRKLVKLEAVQFMLSNHTVSVCELEAEQFLLVHCKWQ